jgi:hypothetical protein
MWLLVYALAYQSGGSHGNHLHLAIVARLFSTGREDAHLVAACPSAKFVRILL